MDEIGGSSVGSEYTGDGNDSELEGLGSESVISFEAEDTASEGEGQVHLQKKDRNKIKGKMAEYELRCLNDDILRALKKYKENRENNKKKKLSTRRRKDIKRIRTLVRNHKKFKPVDAYIQALKNSVSEIRGGKFLFNKNKSTLKDTLNEIIRAYTTPVSLERRRFYVSECHYTQIQRTLMTMSQRSATALDRVQLDETNQRLNNSNNSNNSAIQASTEVEELKRRIKELEDDNANLRSRLKVRSGGGSGDSKQSKAGKSPPNNHSINGEDSAEDPASGSGLLGNKRK